MRGARPFPFDSLPRLCREQEELLAKLRAELGPGAIEALSRWSARFLGDAVDGPDPPRVETTAVWAHDVAEAQQLVTGGRLAFALRADDRRRAFLLLDDRLVAGLRAMLLRLPAAPTLGPLSAAERGLVGYVLAALLHELGPQCPWLLEVEGEPAPPRIEGSGWCVAESRVTLAGCSGLAWLAFRPAALRRGRPVPLRTSIFASSWRSRHGLLRELVTELPLEGARFRLPFGEVALLGPGDVVVFEGCPHPGQPLPGRIRLGEGGFPAELSGTAVAVKAPYGEGGLSVSGPTPEQVAAAAELPVELVVELGRLRLTVAEVLELEPGKLLTVGRPLGGQVDLRAGDRLLARGELVDVDGEAGVRILEVFSAAG